MRMRKTRSSSSSSSSPRPPRSPGVDRFGRSGLDSPQFHTGKVTVLKADADNPPHRCARCHHAPLIGSRCPSCGLDNRAYRLARDHRRQRQHRIDDDALGDDLDDPDEGLLGNRGDDDATDEGE